MCSFLYVPMLLKYSTVLVLFDSTICVVFECITRNVRFTVRPDDV